MDLRADGDGDGDGHDGDDAAPHLVPHLAVEGLLVGLHL